METKQNKEKVILVGVETNDNQNQFDLSMKELTSLTKTANGEVVFVLTQKRPNVDRQTIVGKGKLEELVQLADAHEADLIVFNHELTPRQNQLISEAVGIRVIDRIQLILDIFAMRARSKEGKLQVELAQLNYLMPRLVGQGLQLSRLGGGIGTRGPGETKLETDRRHIRRKISSIKKELKEVAAHRERSRQKRQTSEVFQIGLIGYTNAGKSTILNMLTSAGTYSEDQLFATLDPLTKKWQLPQGLIVTVTDTVGFIQDLPTQLVEAFHATLEESQNMDLLLHVVDASAPDRLQQEQTVLELLSELELLTIPILTVYNKLDKIDTAQFTPTLFPNCGISAKSSIGKENLTDAVARKLMEILVPYEFVVAPDKGNELSELRRQTLLLTEAFQEAENNYLVKGFAKQESKWLRRMNDELDK